MTDIPTLPAKEAARQFFRAARRELSPQERLGAAELLAGHVGAWLRDKRAAAKEDGKVVAAYLSVDPEPGTDGLLDSLVERGYDVVVPVCEPRYQLSWCRWRAGTGLRKSVRAPLLEPAGQRYHFADLFMGPPDFSLVLVPGLAIDRAGNRLGQGGGYYDRFLAQLRTAAPDAPAAGYLYEHELVPEGRFESTALDMPLPGAFTPSGFHRLGAGTAPV